MRSSTPACPRRGVTVILIVLLMVPMIGVVALAVDYGYLLKVRSDLQRAADMTALAAVQDLIPNANGFQDRNAVVTTAKNYAAAHFGNAFSVRDADVQIGRYDPTTIYSQVTLLNSGVWDAVRVTLRRDVLANSPVSLFFAPVIGVDNSEVVATATAVLQKGSKLGPGVGVLPFSVLKSEWDSLAQGDTWSIYGDGHVTDEWGNNVPGNWGTLDIGAASNGTSALNNQILDGLTQSDLDALRADNRISHSTHIDVNDPAWLQADTGLSSGLKSSVTAVQGEVRIIPLYDASQDPTGNNLEFHVTDWGVVEVVSSAWNGDKNTYIKVKKAYLYDGDLRPHPDLGDTNNVLPVAFTSPVLVE